MEGFDIRQPVGPKHPDFHLTWLVQGPLALIRNYCPSPPYYKMSISSTSICSLSCSSGSSGMEDTFTTPRQNKACDNPNAPADRKATGDTSQKSWRDEITGRIHFFPGSFEQFLEDLVPCSAPYTLDDDLSHAFDEYVPVKGQEVSSYGGLVSRSGISFSSL